MDNCRSGHTGGHGSQTKREHMNRREGLVWKKRVDRSGREVGGESSQQASCI